MGAINFTGGSWVGGGYGKLFTDENFTYKDEDIEEDVYDSDYSLEVFEHIEDNIETIEELMVTYINEHHSDILVKVKHDKSETEREISISDFFIGWQFSHNNILILDRGYYSGFQLYCEWRNIVGIDLEVGENEIYYLDDEEGKKMANLFNDVVTKIEFGWFDL